MTTHGAFPRRAAALLSLAPLLQIFCACVPEKSSHAWFAMDTEFSAVLYNDGAARGAVAPESAFAALERESARMENLFSDFLPASDLARVTGKAGDTLATAPELAAVLGAALEMGGEARGTFDVTLHRLKLAWGLASGDSGRIPAEAQIAAALRGNPVYGAVPDTAAARASASPPYKLLPPTAAAGAGPGAPARLVLLRDSLWLDLGGIAKGYAVDRMHAMLDSLGFPVHLVQAGGDMRVGGDKPGGWRIGIRHPRRPDTVAGTLALPGAYAVSTSGDYERFFIGPDGVRYHHIFDPRTGRPARPWCAVTVLAPTSLGADALTKPLFVLGPEKGLALLHRFRAEALWIREIGAAAAPGASLPGASGAASDGLCTVASPGMARLLATALPACHDPSP